MVRWSARCAAADALVIGYGSDLRSDDAAGRRVAAAVEARGVHGMSTRSVAQLVPELALDIAGRDVVVFVDASVADEEVTVREIDAVTTAPEVMTHHGDPATILSMVASVGDRPPRAYVVSVPAVTFDFGTELSDRTATAVQEAVEVVLGLVAAGEPGPR